MGPKRKKADSSTTTTHLVFQEGNSNKFWKITIDGTSTIVNYGKVGTAGQTSTKEHKDAAAAEKFATKEIAGKKKKGYNEAEADANSTSEKPSKVTKKTKSKTSKIDESTNGRRWVYLVYQIGSGMEDSLEVFSSKKAYMILPYEDFRDQSYITFNESAPYGANIVETLDEAKRKLDAIFECGSAEKVYEAEEKGKIEVGPIYDSSNFVESSKDTDVYTYLLYFDVSQFLDSEFVFVLDSLDDFRAFEKYFQKKCNDYNLKDDDIWLKLREIGSIHGTLTLKKMKELAIKYEDDEDAFLFG